MKKISNTKITSQTVIAEKPRSKLNYFKIQLIQYKGGYKEDRKRETKQISQKPKSRTVGPHLTTSQSHYM